MNPDIFNIIAYICIVIAIIAILSIVLDTARGEQYKFNMTQSLEKEQRVLDICIQTDIYLPFCDTRLGSIDKIYGEKIDSAR